jgi:alkyl-hydroperoxide reductase/thiol specific antioxidant family protein
LGEHHDEIRAAGGDVVAIFQYRAEPTFNFCRKRDVPFDCLGDPQRAAYHAVGLERGSAREYVGPQLAKGFLRAARHGALPGNPEGGDVAQRPGIFVVSPEGRVLYAHYNKDSADNPPMSELLEAVRAA